MSKLFRGIVATGASRKQAVSNYRLLARGKNVQAFAGQGNDVFIAALSADAAFNPTTGDLDMTVVDDVLDQFDFASNSSTAEVNYTVCNTCQSHIIADDAALVSHCSECGDQVEFPEGEVSESDDDEDAVDAALEDAESEDEEPAEDAEAEDEDAEEPAEDDADEADEPDADAEDEEPAEDDTDEEDEESEEVDATIDLTDDDPDTPVEDEIAEAAASLDEDLDDTLTVVSASYEEAVSSFAQAKLDGVSVSSGELDAHYMVCHNCECHIVSESAVHECPSCSGDVSEPDAEDVELELGDTDLDVEDEEDASESEDLAILDEEDDVDAEEDADADVDVDLDAEDEPADEEDEASESAAADIQVDTLIDGVPADAKAEDLDVSFSSVQRQPMWTLFHKGQPVATAVAANAGDKADLFARDAFGHAFLKSVSAGVPAHKAAADFGFRGFDMTAAVSAAVSRQAQDEIASHSADAQAQVNAVQENLMQALSTAAMGINRGFFEGVQSNPLRDSLMQALSMAGVANPDALLDRAWAASADSYHGLLFNQAIEILRHPREVQESMSSAVQRINMVSTSASNVHSRVGHLGTPAPVVAPAPAATDVQVSESSNKPQGGAISAAMSTFR